MGLRGKKRDEIREAIIVGLYCMGGTFAEIGERLSISRQAVEQVVRRAGICINEAGVLTVKPRPFRARYALKHDRPDDEDKAVIRRWVDLGFQSPWKAFSHQRTNAASRGVGWQLTFKQWMGIWGENYAKRGLGSGNLAMCRYGDTGPYSVDNVYLASSNDNVRHYFASRRTLNIVTQGA